ncbi:MAG: hypothetical protein L0271_17850 [Gemmatimonadetes bacterium]|nr:hypothetical protein [Gemmatimonadota bacterium]
MIRPVILFALLIAAPLPVTGQARIESRFPESIRVVVQRLGAMQIETVQEGAADLLPGDMLIAADTAFVELRCPVDSNDTYRLTGPFRVLIDVPHSARCHINLLSGDMNVLAELPTGQTVGPVTLASSGTQYAVVARRTDEGFAPRVLVFDGDVTVRSAGGTVGAGPGASVTYDLTRGGFRTAQITDPQLRRWSGVYARFDVAEAIAMGAPAQRSAIMYARFDSLHYGVLNNPDDPERRAALARAQVELRVIDHARFNLERAGIRSDSALRRYRIDPDLVRVRR